MVRRPIGCGLLAAALIAACSDESSGTTAKDGGTSTRPPGDSNVLVGTFQVRLVAATEATDTAPATAASTAVIGKVYDGAALSEVIWEDAGSEGSCKLLTPRVPFCNSPCGGSAACIENDVCKAYPVAHGAGTVTLDGLRLESGATTFTMNPVVNGYQPAADVKLASPAFSEGDAIELTAAGDYYDPFSIEAKGIAPLVLTNDTIPLEAEQPTKLTWAPPAQPGISKIEVKLDISHHGGTKGKIECASEDTGALEIPAVLVTKLLALGVAGFPTVVVTRKAVGSTTIPEGRVDLVVSSSVEHGVAIAGLSSCTDDAQCQGGQTCQADLTCK